MYFRPDYTYSSYSRDRRSGSLSASWDWDSSTTSLFKILKDRYRKEYFIATYLGDKLRNKVSYSSVTSWNVPAILERAARWQDESIITCGESRSRIANLEDILAIATFVLRR